MNWKRRIETSGKQKIKQKRREQAAKQKNQKVVPRAAADYENS